MTTAGRSGARLCLAWARGPAHVVHARGQYMHLSAAHTASALVSGLSLTWYYEFRLTSRQNTTLRQCLATRPEAHNTMPIRTTIAMTGHHIIRVPFITTANTPCWLRSSFPQPSLLAHPIRHLHILQVSAKRHHIAPSRLTNQPKSSNSFQCTSPAGCWVAGKA